MTIAGMLAVVVGLALGLGIFVLVVPRERIRVSRVALSAHPWRAIAASVALALLGYVCAVSLTGVLGLGFALGALGASVLPWWTARRNRRRAEEAQACFPELIETLIARVRSGDTVMAALGVAAQSAPPSISDPARACDESYRMTGNVTVALDDLKRTWADSTGDLLVETLRVAHATGGSNTVVVLRDLADQIRMDRNTRRDIEAKQSWVRVAARVGVAAPWVVLIFLSFRPEAATAYNSPTGLAVLIVGLGLSVCAYWSMLALGRTTVTRRVFDR